MSTEPDTLLDAVDLSFCLYDWLDVEGLTALPHRRASDEHEPVLVDGKVQLVERIKPAVDAFAEAGVIAATMDEDDC